MPPYVLSVPFEPLNSFREYPPSEMKSRSEAFYEEVRRRRTVREFSSRSVDRSVIEQAILAAGSAPSGANMQPWQFVVVSDISIKQQIRSAAEAVERDFYEKKISDEWREALAPLGTDADKSYLETVPYLIVVFATKQTTDPAGRVWKHYYIEESVGIATGILITALHVAGLATLTHTPSPMGFLGSLLGRPESERPFLIVAAGYPAENATVPVLKKKRLEEIATFV